MALPGYFPLLSPQVATMLLILAHAQHDEDVRAHDPYSRFTGRGQSKGRPKPGEPRYRALKHRP